MKASMSLGLGAGLVAVLAAGLGAAQTMPTVTAADWLKRPTADELFGAWPRDAKGSGKAVIDCLVSIQGTLRGCEVASETPEGSGFGAAALTLVPQFLMKPFTVDGKPVESRIRIPINFDCGGGGCNTGVGLQSRLLNGLAWAKAPTYQDFVAAYPKKAREKKVGGTASLNCLITGGVRLTQCSVMSEHPKGQGFGAAAKALAGKFETPINVAPGLSLDRTSTRLTFTFDVRMLEEGRSVVGKPKWTRAPTMAEAAAVFPKQALAEDITTGRAIVRCVVAEGGELTGCAPTEETPVGKGFGEAAVKLMPLFRMDTYTDEGLPVVGGAIRVPITFNLKLPPQAAAPQP